jgi:hypothetical protein
MRKMIIDAGCLRREMRKIRGNRMVSGLVEAKSGS